MKILLEDETQMVAVKLWFMIDALKKVKSSDQGIIFAISILDPSCKCINRQYRSDYLLIRTFSLGCDPFLWVFAIQLWQLDKMGPQNKKKITKL